MAEWQIYHNPRCTKSRQTLQLLQKKGVEPEIVEYLKTPPTKSTLKSLIAKLGIAPHELLRKKESVFKGLKLNVENDNAVLDAMVKHPVLIERPIVVRKARAVIGRPPENIKDLL